MRHPSLCLSLPSPAILRGGGWIALALAVAALLAPPARADGTYLLDTQDRLMIRVVEWQTVQSEFRDWSAVTGEYTVGPAGTLSLPLIGEVQASGKTTGEIAELVASSLQQKLGLPDRPEASVELAQFRPFYVTGDVRTPGEYPYVPNLTVLKAMSIAGGDRRASEGGGRVEKDLLNARGGYDVLADAQVRLAVKLARIEAELAEREDIEVPPEHADNPLVPSILADEQAIMAARQRTLALQLEALDDLKELLQSEIVSLEQKVKTQTRQRDLAQEELADLGSLAQEGLVVNTRVLGTERSVADMEGKLLDLETAILRAKQEISKTSQEATELSSTMRSDLAIERQQVEAALNETALKLRTQRNLIAEAVSYASGSPGMGEIDAPLVLTIVREADGKTERISASEDTAILPGDVLQVRRELNDGAVAEGQ